MHMRTDQTPTFNHTLHSTHTDERTDSGQSYSVLHARLLPSSSLRHTQTHEWSLPVVCFTFRSSPLPLPFHCSVAVEVSRSYSLHCVASKQNSFSFV